MNVRVLILCVFIFHAKTISFYAFSKFLAPDLELNFNQAVVFGTQINQKSILFMATIYGSTPWRLTYNLKSRLPIEVVTECLFTLYLNFKSNKRLYNDRNSRFILRALSCQGFQSSKFLNVLILRSRKTRLHMLLLGFN